MAICSKAVKQKGLEIDTLSVWKSVMTTKDNYQFLLHALIRTIDAYHKGEYSKFDAQTNTTCCHGVAVLASELIYKAKKIEFKKIREKILLELLLLDSQEEFSDIEKSLEILPNELVDLCSLYVLSYGSEISPERGKYTSVKSLKNIFQTNKKFREKIIKTLQRAVSNIVAENYEKYLDQIGWGAKVNNISTHMWGKYIRSKYLRTDIRKVKYASHVYSMQVLLSYLIVKKSNIAIIHDIIEMNGKLRKRNLYRLKGDGKSNFKVLTSAEYYSLEPLDLYQSTITFFGFSYEKYKDESLDQFKKWLNDFPLLVLACDVNCSQFPEVKIDQNFNSNPIIPNEKSLRNSFQNCKTIKGTSLLDAHLFCLSHIFCSSIHELMFEIYDTQKIPLSHHYIPEKMISQLTPTH